MDEKQTLFVKMPGLDDLILIVLVWNFIAVFVLSIFQIRDVEGYTH